MATARETIQKALRKIGVAVLLQAPSATQLAMGLTELNQLISQYAGFGVSLPPVLVKQSVTLTISDDEPSARLAAAGGITITLPEQPVDGARVQVIDVGLAFAGAPVTLSPNGWLIEGATANLTLNTAGLNRAWMFRPDLAAWVRAAPLLIDDVLPFPEEFDAGMALLLAQRLAGEYGRELSPEDRGMAMAAHTRLRARYAAPPKLSFSDEVARLGDASRNRGW
jgi:hypothetical protein